MAIPIRSPSKHSPSLPNISFSSCSTMSSLKVSSLVYTHSSSNHTCITIQENASIITTHKMEKLFDLKERESDVEREHSEVTIRRMRRRKRRRNLECVKNYVDDKIVSVDKKAGKSRFMTPKEEARFSWYLKERARVEAVRTELLAEMAGRELSSSQWAKAAGISQHNLDRILCNGRESEERITSCYHRLVVSVASSYQGKGLSLNDLTQEGSIGLLRGATKFNPEKGYKLSTYAYWWIRQSITRAIAKKSKIIRLPGSINELVPRICEANAVLSRKLHRYPTYDEIAEAIGANSWAVRLAMERNRSLISLDQATTSQGVMSLQDIIPGPDELTPEAMVKKDLLKPEIRKLLEPLCDREAHILRLHYGLCGGAQLSFEEIGRLFKLSRERVRQINSEALFKLLETSEMDDLKYFI